jgi:hypothetical protein
MLQDHSPAGSPGMGRVAKRMFVVAAQQNSSSSSAGMARVAKMVFVVAALVTIAYAVILHGIPAESPLDIAQQGATAAAPA